MPGKYIVTVENSGTEEEARSEPVCRLSGIPKIGSLEEAQTVLDFLTKDYPNETYHLYELKEVSNTK